MTQYEHDMSQEKEVKQKRLLPEGKISLEIINCVEKMSKSQNKMFVITFFSAKDSYSEDVYAIATPGKRWVLKSILAACGVEAAEDGVYRWDIANVIGKKVTAFNTHEDNNYINREGVEVKAKQNRLGNFEAEAWDE